MTRPRPGKLWLLAAVVVGLALLVWVLALALVPRERLAEQLAREVAQATGARLDPGQVDLKLLGGLGIHLANGNLSGQGAELARRTGVGQGLGSYELEYASLDVTLDFGALVRRQLEVRQIAMKGPRISFRTANGPVAMEDYAVRVSDLELDLSSDETSRGLAPGERIPADLIFDLRADMAQLHLGETQWNELRLVGSWRQRGLDVSELSAEIGGGTLLATGDVDFESEPWGQAAWTVQLQQVDAGPLLLPFWPELGERLSCRLDGEATGSLGLRDQNTALETLTVTGNLAAAEGVLRARDWLAEAGPYLGDRQDLMTIRFDRLAHGFRIQDGRYLIDKLALAGPDTDWQATGWLSFGGDLDLRVGLRLPAGFTPDLGGMSFLAETLRDDEGRVRLGLKLQGKTVAPRFGLDFSQLGRRP